MHEPGTTVGLGDVPIGCEVYTLDSDRLGEVKEVRGSAFKVNAAMQPDYWLPTVTISSITADRIMLSFHTDRLNDFKRAEPFAA